MRLANATAIVTGGAQGMGEAHVRALVDEGARVVLGDVDERGRDLAAELGDAVRFAHLDVADEAHWQSAVELAEGEFGPVSVLVNNAGVLALTSLADTTLEQWRRVLDVNLTGTFLGIRTVTPSMREAGGGAIVNISSIGGLIGIEPEWAYTASKWGVRGLTKTAAIELGRYGIRVNSIHPGMIRTRMIEGANEETASARYPIARFGSPEEVARLMLAIVCEATYSTGAEFVADGGMLAGIRVGG